MSDLRAAKSGLARDVQLKNEASYDQRKAKECVDWISKTIREPLDTDGSMSSVEKLLNDGIVLCKLYKAIDPACKLHPEKEKPNAMAFVQRERIGKFLTYIKGPPLNIKEHCTFSTVDLFEATNMWQVIICLQMVGSACLSDKIPVEGYGIKESHGHKRDFTEEQLAQGKSVIGLQMGSNKGASQAGQNFGKSRMITD